MHRFGTIFRVSIKMDQFLGVLKQSFSHLIVYNADEIFHWTRSVNCVFNLLYTNNRYTE